MLHKEDVRKDILEKPCAKCGGIIPDDADCIISFYRGSFIILHHECDSFLVDGIATPTDRKRKENEICQPTPNHLQREAPIISNGYAPSHA